MSAIGINSADGIEANNCHFKSVTNTKATTPKEPIRLSFMISSLRSLSRRKTNHRLYPSNHQHEGHQLLKTQPQR